MVRGLPFVGCFLALLAAACASPTLPLPPPETPDLGAGTDSDHVKLSSPCGGASPNSIIVVVNTNTAVPDDQAVSGAIVNTCGSWDANVYAHTGDFLNITQQVGDEVSQPLVFEVTSL